MKLGKLILCSNLKVLREVLNHNENSILIDNFTKEKNWIKRLMKLIKTSKIYLIEFLTSFLNMLKHMI